MHSNMQNISQVHFIPFIADLSDLNISKHKHSACDVHALYAAYVPITYISVLKHRVVHNKQQDIIVPMALSHCFGFCVLYMYSCIMHCFQPAGTRVKQVIQSSMTSFATFTSIQPVFASIVMTSSSGINTAMHTIWSVLAQASSKIFPVYCVHRTVTNWNLETSQCPIKTCLILTKLCILKKFWQTIFCLYYLVLQPDKVPGLKSF